MGVNWHEQMVDQLAWHWEGQLRPRFAGLTDAEYLWEPVAGCWSVRPRGTSPAPLALGGGALTIDWARPEPSPPPVTTIAWRLAHVIVGVFGQRVASHFGGPPMDYDTVEFAGTADEALAQLDAAYGRWIAGVRGLDDEALARPVGPAEGPWHESPMAALVFHINREAIHHGAEVALLRDLYAARG